MTGKHPVFGMMHGGKLQGIRIFFERSGMSGTSVKLMREIIQWSIDKYVARLQNIGLEFSTVFNSTATDFLIVKKLQRYASDRPLGQVGLNSMNPVRRKSKALPVWVQNALLTRPTGNLIYLELYAFLGTDSNVKSGASAENLVAHELAHNLTWQKDWVWNLVNVPARFGPQQNLTAYSFWGSKDLVTVRARSSKHWYEYSADFIASWGMGSTDVWLNRLMKCYFNHTDAAKCDLSLSSVSASSIKD